MNLPKLLPSKPLVETALWRYDPGVSRLRALSCVAIAAFACALILGVSAKPAAALSLREDPFVQQGERLTSSEMTEHAEQGYSVALSANGDTALIGAPGYKSFAGAAWVYTRTGSVWTEQQKLEGTEGSPLAHQGWSVALSADGDTALVGGYEEEKGGVFTGAAWVFTRSGSTWSQQQILIGAGTVDDEEGYSVALSAEGNTALIGGPDYEDGEPGAAWVFTRSGTTWSEQAKLVGAHPSGLVQKGWSVALSGDGGTALIGGPSAEFKSGEPALGGAWVFTRSGTTWKELEQLPSGSGAGIDTGQGQSVALSGNGTTALVGGIGYQSNLGGAWVYALESGHWKQQGPPLLGNDRDTQAEEGESAALSEDGNTALVGGYHDDVSRGAAWAFLRSGSTWSEPQELVGTGGSAEPTQGNGVALSGDGLTALIGAPTNEENGGSTEPGAAWVFTRPGEPGVGKEPEKEPSQSPPSSGNVSTAAGASSSGGSTTGAGGNPSSPPAPTAAELEERLATAFGLPSSKLCYSKRSFKIHIQQPHGYPKVVSAEVFLGNKRERSLNKQGLTDEVVLKQLPYGTFTIRIVARTVKGTTLTGTRTYHTCRPKPIHPHGHPRL
jgi:FG-GAP repeat